MLFASLYKRNEDEDGRHTGFQSMVVCPSRCGAHICFQDKYEILFKAKLTMTHSEHAPRYNVYNVNEYGRTAAIEFGHMEKGRTTFVGQRGQFKMEQSWHVGVFKMELRHRKGVLHPKTAKMQSTPVEAWSQNVTFTITATHDFKTKKENWDLAVDIDSASITIDVEKGHSVDAPEGFSVIRVYENGELICVGRRQSFEHTGLRAAYQRPFVGIKLKANADDLRAGMQSIVHEPNNDADASRTTSNALDKVKSGLKAGTSMTLETALNVTKIDAAKFAKFHPLGCGPEVLPLLVVLAWAEESMHPPADLRDYFIKRMRTKNARMARWNSDEGTIGEDGIVTGDPSAVGSTLDSARQSVTEEDIMDMLAGVAEDQEILEKEAGGKTNSA